MALLCLKENASSLDICALSVEGRRLLRTCGNVSTIQRKSNCKSFNVTSPPQLDQDGLLGGFLGGVDMPALFCPSATNAGPASGSQGAFGAAPL